MLRKTIGPGLVALLLVISFRSPAVADATEPINFTRGTLTGAGFTTANPGALTFGPDGRLYVADTAGRIQALTLDPVTKAVTSVQAITTSAQLQEVYGIAFDPDDTSNPPAMYVTNTISGFGDAGQAPPGAFSGKVTKIHGTGYATRTDIITGLPVNNSGHQANGLVFGPDGRLFIAQGGATNAGIINSAGGLFQREETPLSGAILVADVNAAGFNGAITYSPPDTYSNSVAQTGGDVDVYSSGWRNAYDLLFHSNGLFYATDNGPNAGYGEGSLTCSTHDGVQAQGPDELNIVVENRYYGHPNRNRGINQADPLQCDYKAATEPSSGNYVAPIGLLPASSNGIVEYTYGGFGGQMQGDLLYVSWVDSTLHRVKLSPDGSSVVYDVTLATNLPNALDVTVGGDGTIYVAEYGGNKITFFKPDETPVTGITVTGINPVGGPVDGGQAVTITGTNFTTSAETTAAIGGAPVTNLVVQNSTTITGVTSANTAGLKDVVVTNSIGTGTLTNGYNYSAGGGTTPPIADAGDDWSGPIAHNTHAHVTVDGRNSVDPDGFIVSYEWKLGETVLSTNPVDSLLFELGEYLVTLTVTDNDGYTDTDQVRIVVTQFAENPELYYCFDVQGDTAVNVIDLQLVAAANGKNFYQHNGAGYTRLRDWNADRYINVIDLVGTAQDFTTQCPLVDQQIRAATVGMEQYQNINNAIADGFVQITPYIPGQGLHMLKGALGGQDDIFIPGAPESLLYEPDPNTPGGWRLGGGMWVMPIDLVPLPPDGFAGNEDAWHYHDDLCIWNNGGSVAEGVEEAWCLSRPGNPVFIDKAGWLVHLWNYYPNPLGRFVEVNGNF